MGGRRDQQPRGRAGWGAGQRGKRGDYDGLSAREGDAISASYARARGEEPRDGRTREDDPPGKSTRETDSHGKSTRETDPDGKSTRGNGQRRKWTRRREQHGSADQAQRSEQRFEAPPRRYPWDDDEHRPRYRTSRLPPLPRDHHSFRDEPGERADPGDFDETDGARGTAPPRKLTVTRVAAWRSRDLTQRAMRLFFSAAHADGADRSGLARFTYAVMGNYAVDAAMAVALANTLFFSAATGESKDKVALYLLITVAPFAVIAPVIGPALDRLQRGRRLALAASFGIRVLLAAVMALNFNSWLLYPAALGCMVLSKSFGVLKAAMTPRVLPQAITLTTANSRLTTFGMAAGGVFGAVASGFAWLLGSEGALWFMAAMAACGVWLCLRIPAWVESTEGEVPASISSHPRRAERTPLTGHVVVALWGNGGIRLLTGFLTLFAAFVIKQGTQTDPFMQLVLLGMVGCAAGLGSFLGNGVGARMSFGKPDRLIVACLGSALAVTVCAAVLAGLPMAVVVGLVGATCSALAKVCLDAVVQRDMPEASRASAFGRSETVLQLSWVFGGALGVLLPPVYWIGFTVVAVLLALVLAQTVLAGRGGSLLARTFWRRGSSAATRTAT
ncbi:MFS transporter [Saccharopolyspora erythraea]|uniref:MFS transporter n=1 Tax=Saccharopolyspora erythraea TaxID=1836 RepID=UPI001BA84AD8|nr:MFS transporter [Saccharopolyspora erythraea]QUG99942.1 MFS transporter [Saccharopolyspora erythraea]